MGIRLLQGRWFRDDDMAGGRDVALVNEATAQHFWPQGGAVGSRLCVDCVSGQAPKWKTVIGVVSGIRHAALDQPAGMQVYLSANSLASAVFLVVRTDHQAGELSREIRKIVAGIDSNQPVFLSATMSTLIGDSLADRRFILAVLAITGCLALVLSTAGVYGVISYVTSRRKQEIGLRMALGATPHQVRQLVFRHGMSMAGIGTTIGLAVSLALSRVIDNVSTGARAPDALFFASAMAVVAITAALACWVPARRATGIDPMTALRED